ncbi:MAG: hypothetical protein AAFX94_09795, partial [Myxococcota bacterium]
ADVHGASPAGLALEEAALAALRSINVGEGEQSEDDEFWHIAYLAVGRCLIKPPGVNSIPTRRADRPSCPRCR